MDTNPLIINRILLFTLLSAFTLTTTACGSWWLPRAHKIDVQQGNLLPPTSVEKIVEGMTKSEVAGVLGEPITNNYFNQQQWDYIYSRNKSGEAPQAQRLTVIFEDDRVVSIEKDRLG